MGYRQRVQSWIGDTRPIRWTKENPIRALMMLIIGIGISVVYDIPSTISIEGQEWEVIVAVLEIIALFIPALAILFQGVLRLSETNAMKFIGKTPELRRWASTIVGITSLVLAIVVVALSRMLIAPPSIDYALYFLALSIAGFALLPMYIASLMWLKDYEDFAKGLTLFEFASEIDPVVDNPDDFLRSLFELHDVDVLIEEELLTSTQQMTLTESSKSDDNGESEE